MKGLFFLSYFSYFLPYTLMIPWLTSLGFSQVQRSWMFAASALAAMIGQILSGFLCDRWKTLRKPYLFTLIGLVVCGWRLYASNSYEGPLLWAGLFGAVFRVNMGILDSWALESDPSGNLRYGVIRGYGALGSILGSVCASIISVRLGIQDIAGFVLLAGSLTLVFALRQSEGKGLKTKQNFQWSDVKALLKLKGYWRMILILWVIHFMSNADILTVIDKMTALGANSQLISIKWILQSLCELPLFLISSWLLKRWSARRLLQFSLAMYCLRLGLTSFASTPEMIVFISGLQLVTFPLLQISAKILIDRQVPVSLRATGQQLALGIYSGCSMMLAPLVFGGLTTVCSYDATLMITGLLGIIPALLLAGRQEAEAI